MSFKEKKNKEKDKRDIENAFYGRSNDWGENEYKALRILNAAHHQLHIITYDQLLTRAKQLLGNENQDEDDGLGEVPF